MVSVTPSPLTPESFRPFGDVVAVGGPARPANDGRAQRYFDLAELTHDARAPRPEVSIYRVVASAGPIEVRYLERHPGSSQLFMPTAGGSYLVVVAPSDARGEPDARGLRAFVGAPGQGVAYAPGVWHYPMVALDVAADFLMFMWEAGSDYDCETRELSVPVVINRTP